MENKLRFYKDKYDYEKKYDDFVKLILKVTNKGHQPIPNLGVFNRCQYVRAFINDSSQFEMTLCNGMDAIEGDRTIPHDSSQTVEISWRLSDHFHGKTFTIQWEYAGIKTRKRKVDLVNKTVE